MLIPVRVHERSNFQKCESGIYSTRGDFGLKFKTVRTEKLFSGISEGLAKFFFGH